MYVTIFTIFLYTYIIIMYEYFWTFCKNVVRRMYVLIAILAQR